MENNNNSVLKIFFPYQCLNEPSGLLLGYHENSAIVVTGLKTPSTHKKDAQELQHICASGMEVVGEWNNQLLSSDSTVNHDIPNDELAFSLINVDANYPLCRVHVQAVEKYGRDNPMILFYEPYAVTSSLYLYEKELCTEVPSGTNLQHLSEKIFAHQRKTSDKLFEGCINFIPCESSLNKNFTKLGTAGIQIFLLLLYKLQWIFTTV